MTRKIKLKPKKKENIEPDVKTEPVEIDTPVKRRGRPKTKKDLEQRGIRILRYANSTSLQVLPRFE